MRIKELAGMAFFAMFMCILVFLSGCNIQTLRPAADAGLSIGAMAAPQYAGVIEQIKRAISGSNASPVEGFEFKIIYRYQGAIVDAADISWEEVYTRRGSAVQGLPPPAPGEEAEPATSAEDARLRAEIAAILDAAGITEGGAE